MTPTEHLYNTYRIPVDNYQPTYQQSKANVKNLQNDYKKTYKTPLGNRQGTYRKPETLQNTYGSRTKNLQETYRKPLELIYRENFKHRYI